eukprot:8560431-Pyramimonas_sp.AAC.1
MRRGRRCCPICPDRDLAAARARRRGALGRGHGGVHRRPGQVPPHPLLVPSIEGEEGLWWSRGHGENRGERRARGTGEERMTLGRLQEDDDRGEEGGGMGFEFEANRTI